MNIALYNLCHHVIVSPPDFLANIAFQPIPGLIPLMDVCSASRLTLPCFAHQSMVSLPDQLLANIHSSIFYTGSGL